MCLYVKPQTALKKTGAILLELKKVVLLNSSLFSNPRYLSTGILCDCKYTLVSTPLISSKQMIAVSCRLILLQLTNSLTSFLGPFKKSSSDYGYAVDCQF